MLYLKKEAENAWKFAEEIAKKFEEVSDNATVSDDKKYALLADELQKWDHGRLAIVPGSQWQKSPLGVRWYADLLARKAYEDFEANAEAGTSYDLGELIGKERFETLISNNRAFMTKEKMEKADEALDAEIAELEKSSDADKKRLKQLKKQKETNESYDSYFGDDSKKKKRFIKGFFEYCRIMEKFDTAAALFSCIKGSTETKGKQRNYSDMLSQVKKRREKSMAKAYTLDVFDSQNSYLMRYALYRQKSIPSVNQYIVPDSILLRNPLDPEITVLMTMVYYMNKADIDTKAAEYNKKTSDVPSAHTDFYPLPAGMGAVGMYLASRDQANALSSALLSYEENKGRGLFVRVTPFPKNVSVCSLSLRKEEAEAFRAANEKKENARAKELGIDGLTVDETENARALIDMIAVPKAANWEKATLLQKRLALCGQLKLLKDCNNRPLTAVPKERDTLWFVKLMLAYDFVKNKIEYGKEHTVKTADLVKIGFTPEEIAQISAAAKELDKKMLTAKTAEGQNPEKDVFGIPTAISYTVNEPKKAETLQEAPEGGCDAVSAQAT